MEKSILRQEYKAKRSSLSTEEVNQASNKIYKKLIKNFSFTGKTVHTFNSITQFKEVNTKSINDFLFKSNCIVATSITKYNPLVLEHSIISKKTNFKLDQFNIPTPKIIQPIQPKEIDLVLIPLLTFDNHGNRIGYGKGLYDSFLKDCSPNCNKIGLSLFNVHTELIATDNHDIKLDYCVTPHRIYHFKDHQ